jgi:predicted transcriptional regulator
VKELDKPNLYVVARFLDVLWWNNKGVGKTRLQMAVRLNYPAFLTYIDWLESHGLIDIQKDEKDSDKIFLSQKGKESYKKLVEWIKDTIKDRDF